MAGTLELLAYDFFRILRAPQEQQTAEWTALSHLQSVLEQGRTVPFGWDAGVYLSADTITAALHPLQGTKVTLPPPSDTLGEVNVTVDRLAITPQLGLLQVALELTAKSAAHDIGLHLNATGYVSLNRIIKGDGTTPAQALFALSFLNIQPALHWDAFEMGVGQWWSTLATAGALRALNGQLTFAVPFQDSVRSDLALATTAQQVGPVTLAVTTPGVSLSQRFSLESPVFTADGVWLLGRLSDQGQQNFTAQLPVAVPDGDLTNSIRELRTQLTDALASAAPIEHGAGAVWINGSLLMGLGEKFGQLSDGQRTITFKSTGEAGRIVDETVNHGLLGDGGYWVSLQSLKGHIHLGRPALAWSDNAGVTMALPLSAKVDAATHVHLHTYIAGGGFSGDVGLEGSASKTLTGSLSLQHRTLAGHQVVLVEPQLQCAAVPVTIETDGRLVIGSGWASMPKLGAQVEQLIGQQAQSPVLLLADIPYRIAVPTNDTSPVKVTSAYGSVDVSFAPVRVDVTHQGYLIVTESAVTPVAVGAPARDYAGERLALQAAIADHYRAQPVACPSADGVRVLVAGIEFGPNNELVKLLVAIGKLPQAALQALQHLGGEVSTEKVQEWVQHPEESFRRSDLGRARDYVADRLGIRGWRL